jgi:2-polyprenyl-3-methyl-5-hydroxy-6-metoxy-1,4-benzoquinol methylase
MMDERDKLHKYWKYPLQSNLPERYMSKNRNGRSLFLVDLLDKIGVKREHAVLEIGCNAGRNLIHLRNAGYSNLYGIEISEEAVELMRSIAPEVAKTVSVGAVEDVLPSFGEVDVIFSMAVLVHLHPDSQFVMEMMAQKARKFIVTVEDEFSNGPRHCARNYRMIFEGLGMRQVYYSPVIPGLNDKYCARAFSK